ncbi:transglycosylase domain-containing protein [Streptomyces sp. NPDC006923]|uniref:transglycosylase domain-containing protein n=1 Tax=Streptomyces sp. NPDC006923 TaxID=3155355 RepID=UPI0033D786A9
MSDEPQQGWAPRDPSATGRPAHSPPGERGDEANTTQTTQQTEEFQKTKTPHKDGKDQQPGKSPARTGRRRFLPTWRTVLGAFLFCALALIGGFVAGYLVVDIPRANAAATAQSNVYLYEDGTQIARDGEINRENIQLAQVPKGVQRAVLAAEDRGFYYEPAIDPQGMIRGAWNTVLGKGTQGGSTITQQYVKNYYLGQEQTVIRKAKEFFIAIKLNREQSKEQILQGYLNTSYFGRNAYGIQAAAQAYYGKDVGDISTAEGAYLASLLNAPSEFDIVVHPENKEAALARWNYVLDGMVKEDWLSETARDAIDFPEPGGLRPSSVGLSGQRGYVVQAVQEYLTSNNILDENTLAGGGYRITTTLERRKQDALTDAVEDHVTSRLDESRAADRNVRVGGASVHPESGHVVAMYGGIDYTKQYVNNATRRDYQVGSTFKPFVFAAAVEHESATQSGMPITPYTIYDGDNERMVEGPDGPTGYAPANEDDVKYGPISVSTATDRSVNAVYAQMAQDVGPATVRKTAVALGLPRNTPDLTATPSIALGPATASVLDMSEAYATLANHGKRSMYTLVTKISKNGAVVDLPRRKFKQAISREAADTTTSILQSVVEGGTGTAAQSVGRPAAGKTGTAEDDKAAWFAGYTPDLATVIAIMGADPVTAQQRALYGAMGQNRINGGGAPAEIWGQYTADALQDSAPEEFDLQLQDGVEDVTPPEEELDTQDQEAEEPGTEGRPRGHRRGGTHDASQDLSREKKGGTTTGGRPREAREESRGEPGGGTSTGGGSGGTGKTGRAENAVANDPGFPFRPALPSVIRP